MALTLHALTTIADVKTELGISGSSEDSYLERLVNIVSRQIANYCGRIFYYEAAIAEKVAGFGDTFIYVSRPPITTITSITFDGSTIASDDYEIYTSGDSDAGAIYAKNGWLNTASYRVGASVDKFAGAERKQFTVTYTGGWITQHQDDDVGTGTRDLPYDLEDACVREVVARYRSKGRDYNVLSEKIGSASETRKDVSAGSSGFFAPIAGVLAPYRIIR